jgi:ubiquinone/menaquinone biosynthesis C-methylase UbiE
MFHRMRLVFLRFAFHLFYNPFAFSYDFVSALVSRGHWRAWTRAAIPHLVGSRVLEIPCGTGNLLLDLCAAGYAPIGVDLSPAMLRITQTKLRRANTVATLSRAQVQKLPFAAGVFDSVVMTFPPGFVHDPLTFTELHRVLADEGRLIWVDAGRLLRRDALSRVLDGALDAVGGSGLPFADFARSTMTPAGFDVRVEQVRDDASIIIVAIAIKRRLS